MIGLTRVKRISRWLPMSSVLLLGLLLSACQHTPAATAPSASVRAAFEHFIDAFNRLDWESFRAGLDQDVTLFNPQLAQAAGRTRIDGRAAVEASFAQVFEAARREGHGPAIVPMHVDVRSWADSALISFEFDRGSGSVGRRSLLFVRRPAGWKIIHIHASNTPEAG